MNDMPLGLRPKPVALNILKQLRVLSEHSIPNSKHE
jgi:hypothetical protein